MKKILDDESQKIDSRKIILGGFSQGGAMSTFSGFQYDKPLGGIISCSGYVLNALTTVSDANRNTPFLSFHGGSYGHSM